MAKIPPITSDNRPSDPAQGEVYYESDTNRIVVFDGSVWHVYNRDSMSYSTGGDDDLHYPQGLYADSAANYYIANSPDIHLDANHIDGLSINSGLSHGDYVLNWYDRTHNNYNMESNRYADGISTSASVHHCQVDLNISSTLSGGACTMPALFNSQHDRYNLDSSAPQSIALANTVFYIAAGGSNVSPFNNYAYWYRGAGGSPFNHIITWNSSKGYGATLQGRFTSNYSVGPHLTIGRQDGSTAYVWDTESGGSPIGGSDAYSASVNARDISGGIFRSSYEMKMWELIIFNQALDISEINTVKSYLQNKYAGLSASLPSGGSTPDLTIP
jgi:hypothetical protein